MNLFQSFIFGVLQGFTEFIPVSSTAHLLIFQKYLGLEPDNSTFTLLVLVQMGTIISLVIHFWKDLVAIAAAMLKNPFTEKPGSLSRLGWYILLATVPALITGYFLKDLVQTLFATPLLEAAIRLFTAAVLLALAEWLGKRTRQLESITWLDALFIGAMQIISVFPGASRSGTTISGGMFLGFKRAAAARFAFLMSIPVILAAGAYQSLELLTMHNLGGFLPVLVVGFVTAAAVGWLAIKWLLNYINKHSLYVFAVYCAVVGVICLLFVLFQG